jgi:hypothetical protein
MTRRVCAVVFVIAIAVLWWSCGSTSPTSPSTPGASAPSATPPAATGETITPPASPPPTPEPPTAEPPAVLVGAGDIAACGVDGARQTAALLDAIDGTVFTAGDAAYPDGSAQNFADCYDPFWGRHKSRTRPAPGNHEYKTPGAAPYFAYFGLNAGPAGRGYYSFRAGAWLVVSLNSNIAADSSSPQVAWLRNELAAQPALCVAAIWHHPLASSGPHGPDPKMRDVWRTLMDFKADLVVTGHDHLYERFTPIDENGSPNPAGMREFVTGTGGADGYEVGVVQPGSEVRGRAWGVLTLTLRSDAFDWDFIPVAGETFGDHGTQGCR